MHRPSRMPLQTGGNSGVLSAPATARRAAHRRRQQVAPAPRQGRKQSELKPARTREMAAPATAVAMAGPVGLRQAHRPPRRKRPRPAELLLMPWGAGSAAMAAGPRVQG